MLEVLFHNVAGSNRRQKLLLADYNFKTTDFESRTLSLSRWFSFQIRALAFLKSRQQFKWSRGCSIIWAKRLQMAGCLKTWSQFFLHLSWDKQNYHLLSIYQHMLVQKSFRRFSFWLRSIKLGILMPYVTASTLHQTRGSHSNRSRWAGPAESQQAPDGSIFQPTFYFFLYT